MTPDEVIEARLRLYEARAAAGLPTCGRGDPESERDRATKNKCECCACGERHHQKHARAHGWRIRELPGYLKIDEVYCPRCFAAYGWGSQQRHYHYAG